MSDEKRRAVLRARVGDRHVLVQDLEAVELEYELVGGVAVRLQRGEGLRLERSDTLALWRFDADDVPHFHQLHTHGDARLTIGAEPENARSGADLRYEGHGHDAACATGGSVAKNRATCWSKRYVEPVTRVPAPSLAGTAPMKISSPPCPRRLTNEGPSFSAYAA